MTIHLHDIWPITSPETYKLHFARWNGENQPLEVRARDKREWQGWQEFRLALLEARPAPTPDELILARAAFWKRILPTRGEYGLNRN